MPRYRRPSSSACCSAPCWWASSATSGNAAWSAWSWRTSTASCASTNSPAPITSCASPTIAWNSGSPATTRACAVRCSVCDNCCASCRAMRHRSMRWRKPCWRCWPSTVRCASPDSTGCATTAPRSRNPWRRSARCRRWTPTICWCAPAWSAANWSACARNCWSAASSVRTARCRCACRWSTPMGGSSPCWRWSRCHSSSSTNVPSACWRSSPGTSPTCCRATVAHCNWPTSTPSASPSTSSAPCWTPATMGCRPACMPSS